MRRLQQIAPPFSVRRPCYSGQVNYSALHCQQYLGQNREVEIGRCTAGRAYLSLQSARVDDGLLKAGRYRFKDPAITTSHRFQ